MLPRLRQRGLRPRVWCLTHRGALADELEAEGVPVHAPDLRPPAFLPAALRRILILPVTVLGLLRLLLRRRPAIVHCFLPAAYLVGAPCALLARVPVRLMSRRSLSDYQSGHPWLARIERRLHPHMTRVLANSRAVLEQLREEGVPEARLHLIYNGVDTGRFRPVTPAERQALRRERGIGADALVLLVVANLIPYKGHADLIEALAGIAGDLPHGWQLLLVGRDDGIGGALLDQARERGIGANLHLLGPRADAAAFMQLADIGVLPSHQEGFSNTLLESMACGLPMVATRVGGNPEAVEDGHSGLLVPPRDPAALGRALRRLALDGELRHRLGAGARRRCEENFALEGCVDAYAHLYRSLLPDGEAPCAE
ncbi:MAG: glycosyltransferase [Gammaproteobacteria bacterium]|nr:MAG: glycosyltransferase [Gammaproteobacteria bacterium]